MPRPKNTNQVPLAGRFTSHVEGFGRLLKDAHALGVQEGYERARRELRALLSQTQPVVPAAPSPAPPRAPSGPAKAVRRKKRRNPWAGLTQAQKDERVRKMLAGRNAIRSLESATLPEGGPLPADRSDDHLVDDDETT